MTDRIASCSCGQLQARTTAEPLRVSVCHCLACQRRTGSVFGAQARFLRASVALTGKSTEFVRAGDEGTRVPLDLIAIPVGAFADPQFPAPNFSVYEERMHSWVQMPIDIEHLA